ncbi:outer membrane beta-barrel protein [Pseudocolwellia agarivorans]|uniref:outer membrane beta-barrel protein n=1 Tax=Pseudocolwellia agarivorans TaxID=1911682 RepID=UPI0011158D35|nr:outer membrane beta-barrel protein [Pseudocolwellia agarivorans]
MKSSTQMSALLKNIVKHSYLLILAIPLTGQAEDRPGLLLNGSVSAEYTDNVLNNMNETSDTAFIINPDVKYLGLVGKHKFLLSYNGKLATYTKDSNLNYNEHKLALGARLDHSHKINTEFKLGFDKITEEPGSTNSSTQSLTEFNQYQNKTAQAKLYYGQAVSTGQIVLGYRYNDREYTNNQQSFRDVEQNQFSATFFYRIAPKTRMLFQASTEEYLYEDQTFGNGFTFNQSSDNNLYLAGVEWEATAKSKGIFKIGYQNKDYDDARLNDISGLSYILDMIWKPNTYTQIKLGAVRQTTESAQLNVGGFLSTSYSLDVSHKIMPRTAVTARFTTNNEEIVAGNSRTDKRNSIKIGVNHSLRKWLNVKLAYKYQEKTSDIEVFNFESNTIELSLETAFD